MKLTILASSSSGNCYILSNDKEALIIELGIRFSKIKQALSFDLSKVVCAIVTHSHMDHACAVKDAMSAGIDVVMSEGSSKALGIENHHRLKKINHDQIYKSGNFEIKAFDVIHDAEEAFGFLIRHPETGLTCFITDSVYSPYTFKDVNNFLVEANYCEKVLAEKLDAGSTQRFLRDRVLNSHFSLNNCKDFLSANNLSQVNNIVILHLSDSHSDAKRFRFEVEQQTGKQVYVAEAGMVMDFNKEAF